MALSAVGAGSLLTVHPVSGPVSRLDDLAGSDDRVKELLFLDLLDRGFYIARRGYMALSMALTEADLDAFLGAIDDVLFLRKPLLPRPN